MDSFKTNLQRKYQTVILKTKNIIFGLVFFLFPTLYPHFHIPRHRTSLSSSVYSLYLFHSLLTAMNGLMANFNIRVSAPSNHFLSTQDSAHRRRTPNYLLWPTPKLRRSSGIVCMAVWHFFPFSPLFLNLINLQFSEIFLKFNCVSFPAVFCRNLIWLLNLNPLRKRGKNCL